MDRKPKFMSLIHLKIPKSISFNFEFSGISIIPRSAHPLNASFLIASTLDGIQRLSILQYVKVSQSIISGLESFAKEISFKLGQLQKLNEATYSTLDGNEIFFILKHLKKA